MVLYMQYKLVVKFTSNPQGSTAVMTTGSTGGTQLLNVVFHCMGSEQSLLECSSSTTDQCTSKAAITCGSGS